MTSHELAKKLLEMPDVPVTHMVWRAGTDQWDEISEVLQRDGTEEDEERQTFGQPNIELT